MVDLPESVEVREVGLRDGLQLEAPLVLEASTPLWRPVSGGWRSPRSSPGKAVPALADAEQLVAELGRWPHVRFSALVAGIGGAERARGAGMANLEYVISASDGHSLANAKRTSDEAVEGVEGGPNRPRSRG